MATAEEKAAKQAAREAAWRKAQEDIARHDEQFERDNPDWDEKRGGKR